MQDHWQKTKVRINNNFGGVSFFLGKHWYSTDSAYKNPDKCKMVMRTEGLFEQRFDACKSRLEVLSGAA